jgi:RHS repeat-associated protein
MMQRTVACPVDATSLNYSSSPLTGPKCLPVSSQPNPQKQLGDSCSSGCGATGAGNSGGANSGSGSTKAGNPVNVSNGNKYEAETDYVGVGANPLRFVRSYNSLQAYITWGVGSAQFNPFMGAAWMASYFQYLIPVSVTDSSTTYNAVYAYRPDGRVLVFSQYGGVYSPDGDVADSLVPYGTGWQYQTADDTIETYNAAGQLVSVAARGQAPITVNYSSAGDPPASVSDDFGHSLQFTYGLDATGAQRLTAITDPAGVNIQYAYDSYGNLASVTYQDGTVRGYSYGDYSNHALITLTDEASVAYASWTYSDLGAQVATSQHAGGVEAYSFTYATSGSGGSVSVTDPLGSTRTYSQQLLWGTYRATGATGLCLGCGEDQARSYDANGNITSRTDFNGNQITYVYDLTTNLEASRTEGYGTAQARTITTSWNSSWRQPALITEPNRTIGFTYDAMGNMLTRTITDSATSATRTWTYTYDSYGRVLTVDGPRTDVSDVTTYTYYTCGTGFQCGQLQTVTDAAGNVTTYNTYNAQGQPLTITDPNGTVTTLTYDARMRLTSREVGTETMAFSYYLTGLLHKVTLPDSSYIQYTYDTAHRLTGIADSAGNSIAYTLDVMSNRTAESSYDPSSTLHRTHTRVYNALNELYKDVGAAGTSGVTTSYSYDSNGNQTGIAAPLSRTTANTYDALNRLNQITDPASGVTHFTYDANDNLSSVTDPRSLSTSYAYNGFGDLTQQVSPDTGTTTNSYDSGGNVSVRTDARSDSAHYSYDVLNRVTGIVYKNSSGVTDQTLSFTYDSGSNGKGRLVSAADGNQSLSWAYDGLGRVTGKGQTIGTLTLSVGYAYTNADLTAISTPSGQAISYTYNGNHQVTAVKVNGTTVLSSVTYEPFGAVNGWNWGSGDTVSRNYNTDGLISQVISASVTNGYSFDNANRITGITDSSSSALSWSYAYDALDRLTSATTSAITDGWTYDANGNRLSQTGTNAITFNMTSGTNQLGSTTGALVRSYAYNAAGMTTAYGSDSFGYNDRGRMLGVSVGSTITSYHYNALGQLIEKATSSPTSLYIYDEAGHLLGEYDGSGNLIEETVWLGDIPVATLRPNGSSVTINYVHTDHLNTPRKVTRSSDNALEWRIDQDPFGTATPNQNPSSLGTFIYNLRFPGQLYMAETGLNYNYLRDYDPQVGRYVESDRLGLFGGSFSTYSYANDNPVMYIDPFGLCWLYIQSTGDLLHLNADGYADYAANGGNAGYGYSGYGEGLNNPEAESIQAIPGGDPTSGPIPAQRYSIGQPFHSQHTGSLVFPLTPVGGLNARGRTRLEIHDDNHHHNHTASTGCIIEPHNVRQRMADGLANDNCLQVIP